MAKKGMLYAAKVMAASAIDALEDPEIIRRAKEELLRRTGGKTYQPPIPAGNPAQNSPGSVSDTLTALA
ncbi:MAG: hypothetical protein ACLUJG_15245 [Lawsonibacter sp.]